MGMTLLAWSVGCGLLFYVWTDIGYLGVITGVLVYLVGLLGYSWDTPISKSTRKAKKNNEESV